MKIRYLNLFVLFIFILILSACSAFNFIECSGGSAGTVSYDFTNIRKGSLERTVTSSGTINPLATVRVLSQMTGKVERIYVNDNDEVRAGQILAELNTDVIRLRRTQQQAVVRRTRANYELYLMTHNTQESLLEKNLISEYEYRTSLNTLENLAAELEVAESNLLVIETEINQYSYIISPINGIVLNRHINIGDIVTDSSSNNSTTLFTLAENLREMQITASVGELDVVSIHRGQSVRFTLESLPGRRFTGIVENVKMIPVVAGNVVSYTVIINAENHDGLLFPGMTCAVNFVVQQKDDIVIVANAALRYQPSSLSSDQVEEMEFIASLANMDAQQQEAAIEARLIALSDRGASQSASSGLVALLTGTRTRPAPQPPSGRGTRAAVVYRYVWFFNDDGSLEVIQVQTGISTSSMTEIIARDDLEGKQVIMREKL
ncbi:MAG: efflux RND transporter periplasmic adaptor subunit [Treponema sp.]|nr:efflux RND transporter periplasmic adaptor subunit [Treponema sp.]